MSEKISKTIARASHACRLKAEEIEQTVESLRPFLEGRPPRLLSEVLYKTTFNELWDDVTAAKLEVDRQEFAQALELLDEAERLMQVLRDMRVAIPAVKEAVTAAMQESPRVVVALRECGTRIDQLHLEFAAHCPFCGRTLGCGAPARNPPNTHEIKLTIQTWCENAGFRNPIVAATATALWGTNPDRGAAPSERTLDEAERRALQRAGKPNNRRPAVFRTVQSDPALLLALTDEFRREIQSMVSKEPRVSEPPPS